MNTDQWLTDGECNLCRRKEYCGKICKAHKSLIERKIQQAVLSVMITGKHRKLKAKE